MSSNMQERRTRHELEFLPAAVEIIETPASPAGHWTMRIIVVMTAIAVAWACLGKLDIIATSSGHIIPSGKVKLVQPLEIGVVKTIHANDGQHVSAGEILIELDPTTNAADRDRAARDLMQSEIDAARLSALVAADPKTFAPPTDADASIVDAARRQLIAELTQHRAKIDGIDRQIAGKTAEREQASATIAKIEASLPFIEQQAHLYESLRSNQYVSKIALLQSEQAAVEAHNNLKISEYQLEAAEAAITALHQSLLEADAEFNHQALDDLSKTRQKAAEFLQEEIKAAQRTGLQVLRAPVDGTVEQLSVHTVGGVVSPAQTLMVVVPDGSNLEVEAMLPNRDVGFVQPGQEAEVKVDAFTYTRYGLLRGRVESVSRDTVRGDKDLNASDADRSGDYTESNSNPSTGRDVSGYIARVSLERTTIETEQGVRPLEPGMAVTAEIKTGNRRIISFLLSPLVRYKHDSLRER